jgi:hypothetical protein
MGRKAEKRARRLQSKRQSEARREGPPSDTLRQRPQEEAKLIREFHTVEKQLAAVETNPQLRTEAERQARRAELWAVQESLGGLDAYQKASLAGEAVEAFGQFSSAEWVLGELGTREAQLLADLGDDARRPALRLLDVGAIVNHYPAEAGAEAGEVTGARQIEGSLIGPLLPGTNRL